MGKNNNCCSGLDGIDLPVIKCCDIPFLKIAPKFIFSENKGYEKGEYPNIFNSESNKNPVYSKANSCSFALHETHKEIFLSRLEKYLENKEK